ncbi:MAG: hypothetical protein AABW85_03500 [archaeon]
MPKILERLEPISFGGKKIGPYFLAGIAIFAVLVGVAVFFYWAPSQEMANGLPDINTQLSKQISSGLKVESKEQAVSSVGAIAQELEKARGTLNTLNKNLEKGEKKEESLSGLLVFVLQESELFIAVIALLAIVFALKLIAKKNPKSSLEK